MPVHLEQSAEQHLVEWLSSVKHDHGRCQSNSKAYAGLAAMTAICHLQRASPRAQNYLGLGTKRSFHSISTPSLDS